MPKGKIGKLFSDVYHGTADKPLKLQDRPLWVHEDPDVANTYAMYPDTRGLPNTGLTPSVSPLKLDRDQVKFAEEDAIYQAAVKHGLIDKYDYEQGLYDDVYSYIDPNLHPEAQKVIDELLEQGYDAVEHEDYDLVGNSILSEVLLDPKSLNATGRLKGRFVDKLAAGGIGTIGAMQMNEAEAMPKGKIGRLFNQYGDDWQKAWHGSDEKVKGALDPANSMGDTPHGGAGVYMTPHRNVAESYRYDQKGGSLIRAEIPGRDNFMPYETSLKEMSSEELDVMRGMFDEWNDTYQTDTTWDEWVEEGNLGEFIEEVGDPWGNQGFGKGAAGYVSENMSPTKEPYEYIVKDARNIRELGRNAVPLAVGGGAMQMNEAEAMPRQGSPNWSFKDASMARRREIEDERARSAIGRLAHDQGGIYGPEHPRILGGIDAVRNIPGADFFAGGLLDVAEDYAFGDASTMPEKITAGLEASGPVFGALSMAGKAASPLVRKLMPKSGMAGKADDTITDADYGRLFDWEEVGDADYGMVPHQAEYDSVRDAITDLFPGREKEMWGMATKPDDYQLNLERYALDRPRSPMERVRRQKEFDEYDAVPKDEDESWEVLRRGHAAIRNFAR